MIINYDALKEFAITDHQRKVIDAVVKHGSHRKAAPHLGISHQSVDNLIKRIKHHAQKRGKLEDMKESGVVPEGFYAETSVKRRFNEETGQMEVVEDWTKSKREKGANIEMMRAWVEGLNAEIIPAKKTKKTKHLSGLREDLASAIIFGDAHIGMLAHALETLQADHDIETATADIRSAIDYCVDCAPPSKQGWFINVGDFTHADTSKGTTHSGTGLDMAARHNQSLKAAASVIRYAIDKMLTKFEEVLVINARGNHDLDAAFALNMTIQAVYENDSRVIVQGNDSKFNFIEFGKNLIGIHHGDGINHNRMAGVMTKTMAEAWGRTTNRRFWNGHFHHKQMVEHDSGITFEIFHTLAPNDAWHAASGYGSESRVTMLTLHEEFGEVNRMSPSLEMLRAIAA